MRKEELIEKSGLSYGTIRKYVDYGLIERPQLEHHGPGEVIAHYPDDSLLRIELIKRLKRRGKMLKEIKDMLPKVLVATMTDGILEKKYQKDRRSTISSGDLWLQRAVELMLHEAGVDDVGRLPAYLSAIQIERDNAGNIEEIRIKKDPEVFDTLEAKIDKIVGE